MIPYIIFSITYIFPVILLYVREAIIVIYKIPIYSTTSKLSKFVFVGVISTAVYISITQTLLWQSKSE